MPAVHLPYEFSSPLRTDRLVLRMMVEADVDDIHAYQSRADVCRYLLFEPRTRDVVAANVAEHAQENVLTTAGGTWRLAVVLDGRVIGDVYFSIKHVGQETAEIGWTLHPDFHGRGYMSEAAAAVLRLAFEEIGVHRVFAVLDPRNAGSSVLCRRLGMRPEAYFVEDMWFKGEWADTAIYALLAREWAARR
jgi:RimJ/RimL family protein N-acetyltransferase